ncbi:anti-sigma factor [Synechococcus sp. CCY9201]|jgi:hypothetical protein|uniref:anti-sigma factor n=1 Tax=unclassified Synechococcus TaxID=2626047 RepID=UPI0018CEF3E0|nr:MULTISPECIES: anti-sigma factor [unclassified Synechococcus]MEA5424129.1 anti-sigma factor [Synechococcus sp. CCY9202]MEA5474101.1 anti-sigma factor [Synechococcus sp. CCY9201]QPN60742.1 anti-sigma factor [Synechococcus sp. CBW1002]QPN67556.1 anti-sigma factor [Synechococcus sp. CBW1006]CAK6687224.1 hypothetical protein IFHNHDMJ_00158 [Synechococcus sp. CBW1107]
MTPHDANPEATNPDAAVDALLAGHALGDLDEEEREQLTLLLLQRPELHQRLEDFRTTLELLPLALPATQPAPEGVRRRLLSPAPQPQVSRRVAAPSWLVPGLLSLGLLFLGMELHQTRQQLAQLQLTVPPSATLMPASRRLPLRAMEGRDQAFGEVLVTGSPTNNILMLNDLPPPPPHHVYRLWANVNGRQVGCVAFKPTAQGHVAMLIPPFPTSQASSLSVSVEADPLGAAPTGPRVLTSTI